MAHKVGDTVTVTRGPHKGDAHKVIHVHKDGRVNVKPHKKMPHQIKYRHGAATAKASEVRKMNEDKDHVSSNHAMHSHENEAQKKAHAAHMKKKHGVKTTYHGNDEDRYHGPKKNVKKALGNHYGGDHDHAKEEHPHIYKEGTIITKPGFKMTDNDKEKLQKIQKMLKRDKAVAKKSTHPGPNEDEDKPVHIVRSKKGTAQLHRISRNDNKLIRKEDVDEACWDTHKQVGMKKKGGKMVPNCVKETGGAGEEGTDKLRKKYFKDTPGQEDILESWVIDLMSRLGSKTINKDKYRKVAQHIKREMGKGKYTSPEFAAADTIRRFNLDIDTKVLAGMIRKLA